MKGAIGIKSAAITGALAVAVLYIICLAAFAVAPGIAVEVGKSLMHGVQIQAPGPISAARAAAGLVASLVIGAVIGIVFAAVCRYTCCREK